ncbi:MAG: hypothetical protein U9P73_07840, partial [Candidatus Cloacimonadota bacterium]|nr:hypothetical protein [Candidatus Cloacimonadota bacterium]
MKRIELLKKAIKNNTYKDITFKKTDVDLIYKLYIEFLELKDYSSSNRIISIFESDQIRQLFNKIDLGEIKEGTIEPKNWSEISSRFDEHILTYMKRIVKKNDYDTFINALDIWKNSFFFTGGITFTRRMDLKSIILLPNILHNNGNDAWILPILERIHDPYRIFKIIENTLLESDLLILKKAFRLLIATGLLTPLMSTNEHYFTSDTNLILQSKSYPFLPEFLVKIKHLPKHLFQVLITIYEHDKKLFNNTIQKIHERKGKYENISLAALKVCVLKKNVNNNLFLIKEVKNFIIDTYTKKVVKEYKLFNQTEEYWKQKSNMNKWQRKKFWRLSDSIT